MCVALSFITSCHYGAACVALYTKNATRRRAPSPSAVQNYVRTRFDFLADNLSPQARLDLRVPNGRLVHNSRNLGCRATDQDEITLASSLLFSPRGYLRATFFIRPGRTCRSGLHPFVIVSWTTHLSAAQDGGTTQQTLEESSRAATTLERLAAAKTRLSKKM